MPLPPNSSISLQGQARLGEGVSTKPKVAMLVRLTQEALDALQNLSATDRVDFQFGDKPGIFIQDQHFSMRYDKEKENQELFTRTTVPTRPNGYAPLRLNANVVGKFTVDRVMTQKIAQKVHEATAAVSKSKKEHKMMMLDEPPDMTTQKSATAAPTRKKAIGSAAKSGVAPGRSIPTVVKSYASSSTPQASSSSVTITHIPSRTVNLPKEVEAHLRQRLIHDLALGAASSSDVLKRVGGVEADFDTRTKILQLLKEVGEEEQQPRKVISTSDVKWQLKPRSWLEVRPYQAQEYTDNVRTRVARSARQRLTALGILETDPAWEHVKYRESGSQASGSGAGASHKNGVLSSHINVKSKAKEPKSNTRDLDFQAKSEASAPSRTMPPAGSSQRPNTTTAPSRAPPDGKKFKSKATISDSEKEEGELSASQTPPRPPIQRLPPAHHGNDHSMPPPRPPYPSSSQPASSSRNGDPRVPNRSGHGSDVDGRPRPSSHVLPSSSQHGKSIQQRPRDFLGVKNDASAIKHSPSPLHHSSTATPVPVNRERQRDARDLDREGPRGKRENRESDRESLRIKRESDWEGSNRMPGAATEVQKLKERVQRDAEEETERSLQSLKSRNRESQWESSKKPALNGGGGDRTTLAGMKRKQPSRESSGDESSDWGIDEQRLKKKSQTGNQRPIPSTAGSSTSTATLTKREREWERERKSLPLKSTSKSVALKERELERVRNTSPPRKLKKEASPFMPQQPTKIVTKIVKERQEAVPVSASSSKASSKGGKRALTMEELKRRRASADYTSSSEDEVIPKPKPKVSKVSKPPGSSSSQAQASAPRPSQTQSSQAPVTRERPPKGTKSAKGLSKPDLMRSRYSSKYAEYIVVFQRLVAQKSKFSAALRAMGSDSESMGSDMSDQDMMPLEELEELSRHHQRLYDELKDLESAYASVAA